MKKETKNENTKNTKKIQEETTEKKGTKKEKGNYALGILGALLGGLIATIPWILVYVYGNMMLSALSIVIAAGEFYGYKLFKGKITKKLPIIIMILAILIVAITTLVNIPVFLIMKEGLSISVNTIKILYTSEGFSTAILKDTIIAIIFTILGASVITANIKRQIESGATEETDLSNSEEIEKRKKDAIKKIKPIFKKFNAFTEEHGILKDELNAEVETENLKEELNILKSCKIVKKAKGRFYYSVESEDNNVHTKKKNNSSLITIVIAVILVVTMVVVILLNQNGIINKNVVSDGNISFEVNGKWVEYTSYYNNIWTYYRYINNKAPTEINNDINMESEEQAEDYSTWPAYLTVNYSQINTEEMSTIQDVQADIKEYIYSLEDTPSVYEENISKSANGYDTLKIKMIFEQEPNQIEYLCYLLNGDELASIDAYSVNLLDDKEIQKTVDEVEKTFMWK